MNTNKSIPQSRTVSKLVDFNEGLKQLATYYKNPTRLLVYHLYEKYDYSYRQVADILEMSPQAVFDKFPKKEGSK